MALFDDILDNVGEPFKGGKGFEYGTHEVVIAFADAAQKKTRNNPDADVIEVDVVDPSDETRTAKATLYFHTDGGAKMSVAKILGILVHNVGEEKKDKVRELGKELFSKIEDPSKARDVAVKLMADKLVGKKAYLVAEPRGKYKTTSYGDLWHYAKEPEEAENVLDGATPATKEDIADIPFGDL